MLYNSSKTSADTVMPLLMGCTMQSIIPEGRDEGRSYYDPESQMTYDMLRAVGTRCLKSSFTKVTVSNSKLDQKNEIDDRKMV